MITWSHKVTWQMKNVFNSLSRDLWLLDLTERWLMIRNHMSNHKATNSFDHVVTWVHVANTLRYTFTSTKPIATKLDRVMACIKEPPPPNWHCSLITWPCVISLTFYLQSQKFYGHQTRQDDNLWHGATSHKVTSTFKQVVM